MVNKLFVRLANIILPEKYYFDYATTTLRDAKTKEIILKNYYPVRSYGYFKNKLSPFMLFKKLDCENLYIYNLNLRRFIAIITPSDLIYYNRPLLHDLITYNKNMIIISKENYKEVWFNTGVKISILFAN